MHRLARKEKLTYLKRTKIVQRRHENGQGGIDPHDPGECAHVIEPAQ